MEENIQQWYSTQSIHCKYRLIDRVVMILVMCISRLLFPLSDSPQLRGVTGQDDKFRFTLTEWFEGLLDSEEVLPTLHHQLETRVDTLHLLFLGIIRVKWDMDLISTPLGRVFKRATWKSLRFKFNYWGHRQSWSLCWIVSLGKGQSYSSP